MTANKDAKLAELMGKVEQFLKTVNRDDYVSEDGYLKHFNEVKTSDPAYPVPESITKEYVDLLADLDLELCGLFITSEGKSSSFFYDIKKLGYHTKVEESDSFGPLACSVRKNEYDWRVSYG